MFGVAAGRGVSLAGAMSAALTEGPESAPAPEMEPDPHPELDIKEQESRKEEQRRSMKRRISLADVEMYLRPFDWFDSLRAKIRVKKILPRLRPAKKQKKVRFRGLAVCRRW